MSMGLRLAARLVMANGTRNPPYEERSRRDRIGQAGTMDQRPMLMQPHLAETFVQVGCRCVPKESAGRPAQVAVPRSHESTDRDTPCGMVRARRDREVGRVARRRYLYESPTWRRRTDRGSETAQMVLAAAVGFSAMDVAQGTFQRAHGFAISATMRHVDRISPATCHPCGPRFVDSDELIKRRSIPLAIGLPAGQRMMQRQGRAAVVGVVAVRHRRFH